MIALAMILNLAAASYNIWAGNYYWLPINLGVALWMLSLEVRK